MWLLNPDFGIVNAFLGLFGIEGPGWFWDPDWALPSSVVMGLWRVGGGAIIYLAGLQNISPHLYEAASVDGASTWVVFARIVMPLCVPPLAVVAVLSFLHSWNEFLMPLIYVSKYDDYTIQLGLSFLKGRFNVEWNLIMAGSILGVIPCVLIFFLAQKHLVISPEPRVPTPGD
jgi:ABC-type glycerol-3-phosphate transport system permease component